MVKIYKNLLHNQFSENGNIYDHLNELFDNETTAENMNPNGKHLLPEV